jgi:uncharacterized protein YukE
VIAPGRGFEVEPAVLSGAAGTLDAEAHTLTNAVAQLALFLDSMGHCWGHDVVGVRFGSSYLPAVQSVLTNMDALSVGLVRIGAALSAVAESYAWTDRTLADSSMEINEPIAGNVFVAGAGVDASFSSAYALNGINAYDDGLGSDAYDRDSYDGDSYYDGAYDGDSYDDGAYDDDGGNNESTIAPERNERIRARDVSANASDVLP